MDVGAWYPIDLVIQIHCPRHGFMRHQVKVENYHRTRCHAPVQKHNVRDKRADKTSERIISPATRPFYLLQRFPPPHNMASRSNEAQLILALKALEKDPKLRLSKAAEIYFVPYTTLYNRRAGRPARYDTPANSGKLTDLEEQTIIRYIVKLYTRAFHPRLCYMEDIANRLLRERDAPPIGKR